MERIASNRKEGSHRGPSIQKQRPHKAVIAGIEFLRRTFILLLIYADPGLKENWNARERVQRLSG
jgi:hypothetical protein